jgi:hypothetical protein
MAKNIPCHLCDNCKKTFYRYNSQLRGKNKYCSHLCRHEHQKITLSGEGNPNFGKKWSDDLRKQASNHRKKQFANNPILRWQSGKANRGKTLSSEIRQKMSEARKGKKMKSPMSAEARKNIGIASAAKFTPEYKEKMRASCEKSGAWIPKTEKTDWETYKDLTCWPENMIQYQTEQLVHFINSVGFWNSKRKNNKNEALVRDHMYSKQNGYKNRVFPEILRHPENCNFITHAENSAKHSKSTILLSELFNRIKNSKHSDSWFEHTNTLQKIHEYENGIRWFNPYNISERIEKL